MKKLIFYFIVLLLAVWLGIFMHTHPGYVLIGIAHLRIELSVWLAIFLLLVLLTILYGILRAIRGAYHIPRRYRGWQKRRAAQKGRYWFERGTYELLAADWSKAERHLIRAANKQQLPLLSYIAAASAAYHQQKTVACDNYLEQAYTLADPAKVRVIDLLQAGWQLRRANWEAALTLLTKLEQAWPHHPAVLSGLKDAYIAVNDWQNVAKLLPKLRQQHVLPEEQVAHLEQRTYLHLLAQADSEASLEPLTKVWQSMPKALHHQPEILAAYCGYLMHHEEYAQAEGLLKANLKKALHPALLKQYAKVTSQNPAKQLALAESWLTNNPDNSALLFCLGQLCAKHQLWGKACSYLETSIRLAPTTDAYAELGDVLNRLGENTLALNNYRQGLELVKQ